MAALGTIATIATLAGTAISAGSAIYQGNEARKASEIAARQERLAGKNEFAAAQREADERRLEGHLIMSRQQAYAAASGGGAGPDAPTITKILTDTGARAEYGAQTVMYGGESRRDDYFRSADAREATGRYNFFGGILRGIGIGAGGVGDWASTPA